MARKSLSDQVLEELDRGGRLLRSVQDSVDPIIGHLLDEVQVSMHRIEGMCLRAKQRSLNDIMTDTGEALVKLATDPTLEPARKRTARQTAAHKRKEG
jgi:hypothetical protein